MTILSTFTESVVEAAALDWLDELGYAAPVELRSGEARVCDTERAMMEAML